jgi:hypothetical protein
MASVAGLGALGAILGAISLPAFAGAAALAALGASLWIVSKAMASFTAAFITTPAESLKMLVDMQSQVDLSNARSEILSLVDPVRSVNDEIEKLNSTLGKLSAKSNTIKIDSGSSKSSKGGKTFEIIRGDVILDNKKIGKTVFKIMTENT